MARMNERSNLYAGRCAYCYKPVAAKEGFVFDDISRGWRNTVRHAHCNEATLAARLEKETGDTAWGSLLTGSAAPTRKVTLDQAFEAGVKADVFPEAEELGAMLAGALDNAIEGIADRVATQWEANVPGMVEELLASHRPISVAVAEAPAVKMDMAHHCFEDVLLMVVAGTAPFLVGPAGSGKTTLAEQVAKALSVQFYMEARVTSEFKLLGFTDANGNVVRTQFRDAYERGGVFLFDEADASDPDAMTAFNAALANGWCSFPDGLVRRHGQFYPIAAGNTFGRGADRQYVGRNQLDAATLDRFSVYVVDYDEALEVRLCGNADWARYVQAVRAAVEKEKIRHVVSPRASIAGAKLIAAGMELSKVTEAVVWKGLDDASKGRVVSNHVPVRSTYSAVLSKVAAPVEEAA